MSDTKLIRIAQTLAVIMISSLSLQLGAETYQIEKAGYINSPGGSIEALCHPGDQAVEGSCEGDYRIISPRSLDVDYPLTTETLPNGFRCKPTVLRADQLLMAIVEVTCKPAATAKIASH